ncbi:hypothetical protein [Paenibacillus aceris]|uniref:Uncharacterized protein n=1 Tax=Paenibacillus aceris TaxID=869555 RepID=A0ABS4HVM5_9BACL|nr:hypothetical protein [Paenibacillus aceris]MBP1962704.1 hypothetical protein [Paenibacillus aceris]NHW33933.1 hypothetical protein [Paenibacillus aceris]
MQRRRAIRGKLEKMLWLTPALIFGIGILPNIAGSLWWDAFGVLLFVAIVIICGVGLYQGDNIIE